MELYGVLVDHNMEMHDACDRHTDTIGVPCVYMVGVPSAWRAFSQRRRGSGGRVAHSVSRLIFDGVGGHTFFFRRYGYPRVGHIAYL